MRRSSARPAAVLALSALALASCAQGTANPPTEGTSDPSAFDPEAEVSGDMSIMGFGVGDEIAEVRYAAAQEALGDGVTISLVEGDLDIQQFLSAVAAGDPPALVYANRDQIGTFASKGAIIPLDACIEGEGIDVDAFRDPAVEQVTFGGSVYGIPEFNAVQITMANAALLDSAGLTIDDVNGSDWEAISAATGALTQSSGGGLSVIGYDSKLPEFLPLWAHANGTDLISEDGRTAQLDDPAVVEALEFAVSVYDAQGGFSAVKAYRDSADFFGAGNQFATSVLGAMPMENWYVNVLNEVSPDAPMAFDTFRGTDGEAFAFGAGSAWAIPAGTDDTQAAACRFMKTMTATDTWMAAAEARAAARAESGQLFTGLLTGNEEADEQIRSEMVDPQEAPEPWSQAVDAIYEANDNAFSYPSNPADAEFKAAWQDGVNRVLNGQASAADSMAQAQEEAQAALDQAWAEWDAEQE